MLRLYLIEVLLVVQLATACSQTADEQSFEIEPQQLDRLLEGMESEISGFEGFLTELEAVQNHPIALRPENERLKELHDLQLLSRLELEALEAHLSVYGPMLSTYELLAVKGLPATSGRKLLPYVKAAVLKGKTSAVEVNHRLLLRYTQKLEKVAGLRENKADSTSEAAAFLGPGFSTLLKYKYEAGAFTAGFKFENDPGEEYRFGLRNARAVANGQPASYTQFGADFISAFLLWKQLGRFSTVLVGDYEIRLGQGLSYWSGFGFGKGSELGLTHKSGRVIKPYTSIDEDRFFRGLAVGLPLQRFDLQFFVSYKRLDASVSQADISDIATSDSTLFGVGTETTFGGVYSSSGLHRTPAELARRNQLGEAAGGLALNFASASSAASTTFTPSAPTEHQGSGNFKAGVYIGGQLYDHHLEHSDKAYQLYKLAGNGLLNSGTHYDWEVGPFLFFGEFSISKHLYLGTALVQGVLLSPHPKVDLLLLYRNYGKSFTAPYSQGLGEGSTVSNERAFLSSLRIRLQPKLILDAHADYFHFPWLRYRVDKPSNGSEYKVKLEFKQSKKQLYYLDFKTETKERNHSSMDPSGEVTTGTLPYHLHKLRLHLQLPAGPGLRWQLRASFSHFQQAGASSKGWMVHSDLRYDKMGTPLKSSIRLALFQTADWDSRLYAYENDVRESFYIPAFYGQGMRFYWTGRYRVTKWLDIEWRYAITRWFDRETVGSGLDKISKPQRSEAKIQLLLKG